MKKLSDKNLLLHNTSRNEIAKMLLDIAEKKRLVPNVVGKFANHHLYSMIFNENDVEGEMLFTVTAVINILERYNFNKTNNISNGELKLDTISHLTGYFINAFKNNINKIYAKHHANKREFNQMVYIDSFMDESNENSNKNKLDSLGSIDPREEDNYKNALFQMAQYLRKQDKKMNKVNQNEKSQLAKLFLNIVNPKKVCTNDELQEKFGWSPYLLRKNKQVLIEKLREEFKDSESDVLTFLDKREKIVKAA